MQDELSLGNPYLAGKQYIFMSSRKYMRKPMKIYAWGNEDICVKTGTGLRLSLYPAAPVRILVFASDSSETSLSAHAPAVRRFP